MNTSTLQWAVGILVTIDLAITGFLAHIIWTHVIECKHVTARLSLLEGDMNRAKEDIGTHNSGMRGAIHRTAQLCQEHELYFRLQHQRKGHDKDDDE